ncbi:MAG: ABC transporter, permease protein (cluster 3, basic aa/glutamine/opines), partial [uncultured Rubrobacteraceae bacterium]
GGRPCRPGTVRGSGLAGPRKPGGARVEREHRTVLRDHRGSLSARAGERDRGQAVFRPVAPLGLSRRLRGLAFGPRCVLAQRADLHGLRSLYPDPGPRHSRGQGDTRACFLPFQAGRCGLHGPLQGGALDPGPVHDRVRRAWPRPRLHLLPPRRGIRCDLTRPRLLGLRRRGLPGRHRVRAREPERGGPLSWTNALAILEVRGPAAGDKARYTATSQRLYRVAEGHGARLGARLHRGCEGGPDLRRLGVQLRELRGSGPPFRPHHHPTRPLYGPSDRPRQTPPRGRSTGM